MNNPKITKLEVIVFEHEIPDLGTDYNGFNVIYEKGASLKRSLSIFRLHTDAGIVGTVPIWAASYALHSLDQVANYLIGKNPFEREKIYNDLKRGLRHTDRTAIGMVDVALWDFAGKAFDAPIYRLLGGYRESIPAYASTYHGDENGCLCSPEAYADFAEDCAGRGFPGFKIHGWGNGPLEREIATIHAVGQRVGEKMDLMVDPACELNTWGEALKLGRACDEEEFFWLEDAYKDGGVSAFGHRKLREKLQTPFLQTEHIFGLEQHVDFIVNDGTDFVRTGTYEDGGITGAMKVAHAAEGFGLDVEFHGGGLAHRHCIAAIRNTNYYELGLIGPNVSNFVSAPIYPMEYRDELESIDKQGHVAVPQGPGLGVELDWDFINRKTIETVVRE